MINQLDAQRPEVRYVSAARAAAVLVVLLVLALAGCGSEAGSGTSPPSTGIAPSDGTGTGGGGDGGGGPAPNPGPTPTSTPRPEPPVAQPEPMPETVVPDPPDPPGPPPEPESVLARFTRDCEQRVREWRLGQVNYPSAFRVMLDDEFFYKASVDVRDSPAEPGETLPGQPEPLGVPVAVKCEVAARLVAGSDDLTVDEEDWRARAFTPTGVIDWTWVVNGVKLGRHELRLEIQPAVRLEDGVLLVGDDSPAMSSFLSSVDVEGTPIQVLGAWVEDNRGPLISVAGVIGAAVIAVLTWTGTLATTVRRVRGQWRGQPGDGQPDDDQPDPE